MKKIIGDLYVEAKRKNEKEYWKIWMWEKDDEDIPHAKICIGEIGPLSITKKEAENSIEPIDIDQYFTYKSRLKGEHR